MEYRQEELTKKALEKSPNRTIVEWKSREWKKLRTITISLGRLAVDELVRKGGYPDEIR